MMPRKSTRAFRTISEAGDELDLQPHVLRFWESKFPQIQPMKRSGGRRFYRPEDIEFLRGIKILLHREKHPIKDVQKLIRVRGAQSVVELGRAKVQAAQPKAIKDTILVPKRIKPVPAKPIAPVVQTPTPAAQTPSADDEIVRRPGRHGTSAAPEVVTPPPVNVAHVVSAPSVEAAPPVPVQDADLAQGTPMDSVDREKLQNALGKLRSLKSRWDEFK